MAESITVIHSKYGLNVSDQAGNVGLEPTPVKVTVNSDAAENKFTNTFLYRIGARFTPQDVIDVHKYDLIAVQGFGWAQVNGDTWGELKKLNPDILIFPYYGSHIKDNDDHRTNPYKNGMARWNISRGHSMGNANTDNPDLFYLTSSGNRISAGPAYPHSWALDYGDPKFHQYWLEAYITDNVNKPWEADGVMIDTVPVRFTGLDGFPAGYSDAKWQMDMQSYLNTLSKELAGHNQIIWGNTGVIKTQDDIDAYIGLDNIENPIYMGNSEGAFVSGWGRGDCQFFAERVWLKQVEVSRHIHQMKYGMQSFVKHERSGFEHSDTGTDNYGKSVTVKDALWYGLCSYHLGKNAVDNNTYFSFTANTYSDAVYYDEYDIDLGNAIDTLKVTNIGGNNIYYREFKKGYVYVNPTRHNVLNIPLPETCKQLTHTNFKNDPATILNTTTINLVSHRGTFLSKSDGGEVPDSTAPKVTSFNINPTTTNTNEQITIDWTVSDDKELKQVELHR